VQKLYIVVRNDIKPGLMVAQSCHALRAFVEEHPDVDKEWFATSNNIVCLEVANEVELQALVDRVAGADVEVSTFTEPDLDDQMTAAAFGPRAAALLSNLPLALRVA